MFNKILMVCIGNICRSPMAEAILKHRLTSTQPSAEISSAGLAAIVGAPAHSIVQGILQEQAIDCTSHRARQLTSAMLLEAELILVMEQAQRKKIECMFPNVCGKVHLLGKWGGFEIADPYKKPQQVFKETYQLIVEGINQWEEKLWK